MRQVECRRIRFITLLVILTYTFYLLCSCLGDGGDVKHKLSLELDLPKTITDRDVLVNLYIGNLHRELQDQVSTYKEQDEAIYTERKRHIWNYCRDKGDREASLSYISEHTLLVTDPAIMYCPVAHSGSTFWTRAVEVIRRKDSKVISPFIISNSYLNEINVNTPISANTDAKSFLKSKLKFVFAQDPYHRVFSTFIDTMLSPNPNMWSWGKSATARFSQSRQIHRCGADVTFQEYIKMINAILPQKIDPHIQPAAYTCDACALGFDIIGKMETFQADVVHILNACGSLDNGISFKNIHLEYKVDYIVDVVIRSFVYKKGWNKCISLHAGFNRLWRQLQIAGLVDKTDIYPLTSAESEVITVSEYLNMALAAFKRSTPAAKRNKQEAYLQAYSIIEAEDLENLRKSYLIDFEMFDYDQKPAELYSERTPLDTSFDYFDVMRLK